MLRKFNLVSGVAILGVLSSAPVAAQDSAEGSAIVVTSAREGEVELGDYAGSITVIEQEELAARNFSALSDLSYTAPNVSLDAIGTFKGVANLAIRGLGINSSIPSIDPAVGLFVDGVYMGVNAGTVFEMFDVEQVEILRGPQGVAFGRNTTGGAVMVRTADPSERFEGFAKVGIEGPVDDGRGGAKWRAEGVVSGPLSDTVSIRLGALHSDDAGYFVNNVDGENLGGGDTTLVRGGIALRSERVRIVAKGEFHDASGDGAPTHSNGLFARDDFQIAVNQPGFHDSEGGFVSLRSEVDLGPGQLTHIFGWRQYDLVTRNDIDSTPDPIFESDTGTSQEQWSNEVTYEFATGPAQIVAGLFAFSQDVGYDESRDLSFFGSAPQYGGGRQETESLGLFTQVDYALTRALSVTAGLRLSHEEKAGRLTYVRPRAACSVIAGTCPVRGERVTGENNGFADERSWTSLSPKLLLSYEAGDDVLLYGGWSRGYRSGGYNLRITQPAAFEEVAAALGSPAFDEERVDTFEAGGNWQSPDNRATIRAALFWTEIDDLQRELNVPSASSGLAQSVYNTADARILGGEVEAFAEPVAGLHLGAHIGLADAEYRTIFFDLTGDGVIDGDDLALELPRAPEWTYGASARYETTLRGTGFLRANIFFQHRDAYAYTDNNWGYNSASDRLDASLAVGSTRSGITVRLYGRNLLDEVQFGGDTQLPFGGGPFSDGDNEPFDPRPAAGTFSPLHPGRVVGIEASVAF